MIDVSTVGLPTRKKYSDSTLKTWNKEELIEYIRILEGNCDAAFWFNEQQARNFEQMLAYMRGEHDRVEEAT